MTETNEQIIEKIKAQRKPQEDEASKPNGDGSPEPPFRFDAEEFAGRRAEPEWPTMDEAAYYGLAGDVVSAVAPHSEADPVALLVQFLCAFGNVIGRAPFYRIEADKHHANLFAALVGQTSKARKGTSWGRAISIVRVVDQTWCDDRVKSGLSSGEGLINEVRDPRMEWDKKEQCEVVVDNGVEDKRLMIIEPEFAGVLAVAERHGNNLSPIIRKAWDGGILSTMTKASPLKATDAHISIVAHVTVDELRSRLTRTDIANGFANRFIYMLVRRSKELPFGGSLSDSEIAEWGDRTAGAVYRAKNIGRITWEAAASDEWLRVYGSISADRPGLLGAVTARAEAQVVRLAMLYAAIDGAARISLDHLRAALAVWRYAEASAAHIFGDLVGDPVADEIMQALLQAGQAGMTRTTIRDLFGRNRSADRIGAALALLLKAGKAAGKMRETGGRPAEVWVAMDGAYNG